MNIRKLVGWLFVLSDLLIFIYLAASVFLVFQLAKVSLVLIGPDAELIKNMFSLSKVSLSILIICVWIANVLHLGSLYFMLKKSTLGVYVFVLSSIILYVIGHVIYTTTLTQNIVSLSVFFLIIMPWIFIVFEVLNKKPVSNGFTNKA